MAKKKTEERVPIEKQAGVKVVATNCFECHSKCGVLAYIKDGKLVKIKGNPDDPRSRGVMCSKGQAAIQIQYSPDRINYCYRRTRPKGDADPGWEKISHEEAMEEIYSRVVKYKEEFGAKSIAVGQGTGRGMNQWTIRLGNTIGQNHLISPGYICMGPMLAVSIITIGSLPFLDGVNVENTNCYVVWGANPLWTEAGVTAHRYTEFMKRGGKMIVIDPLFFNPLAGKADIWLPIRPGTDGALVLCWINIILKEKLYNEEFLKNWTNAPHLIETEEGYCMTESDAVKGGSAAKYILWDEKADQWCAADKTDAAPALFGTYNINGIECKTALQILLEQTSEYTPEKTAEITWLDAAKIKEAAMMYAKSSPGAALEAMQGIEETPNCADTIRGLTILMMITGNLDTKGGNVLYPFWREMVDPRLTGEISPSNDFDRIARHMIALYPASQPTAFFDAVLTDEPYPVKMLIQVAGNPMSYSENPAKVRQALEKLEFLVVRDYFMSETAKLADIVMPAAHWTERDYIADEVCARWVYAQQRAVDPLHDRKSDLTFCRELGHSLAPEKWPWETDEEVFDFQLQPAGITWKELKEKQCHEIMPESYKKYASGDPKWQIMTQSGKFELFSNLMKGFGFNGLPKYTECPETPVSAPELAEEFPLVLTTGARVPHLYHSTLHNIPWLRSMQIDPFCFVNTRTAEKAGIKNNEWVWVESPHGKAKARAFLTECIHPKVVSGQHGWVMGCRELKIKDYDKEEVNINACVSDSHFGTETFTPSMRGLLCRLKPLTEEEKK